MIFDLEGTHAAQAAHAAPPARPRRTQLEVYTHHVSTRLQQAEALGQSPLQALQTRLANYHPYDIVMLQNVFDAPPVPPRPLLFGGSSNSGGGGGGIAGGGGASGASTAGSGGGGGRSRASSPASSHSRGGGGGGGGGSSASRSRAASAAASDASAGDGNGDGDAAMPGTHAATAARALWRRAITMARRSSVGPAPSTHGGGLVSARLGAVDGRSKWYPVHGYNVCGTRAPVGAKPHARDAGLLIYSRFPIRSEAFVQFRDQTDETLCGVLLAEIEVGLALHAL
ncbi:hypothetical protein HK105_200277 [Polyrhizophydium stewartii]|uniref:Uncharacterized protein n=1 Tax=Polyrhizophydium stewartii TaxID=2732419 RepID=A0ABR4NL96_9FUNG